MTDNTIDSVGSELFLSFDGATVVAFDCPTAINGLGFTSTQMNTSCLNSPNGTQRPGRRNFTPITVPFRFIDGSAAQEWLLDNMDAAAVEIPYYIGLANGTADPTMSGGLFVAPTTRTGFKGTCYVSDLSIDATDGEVVMGSFTFLPQSVAPTYKA